MKKLSILFILLLFLFCNYSYADSETDNIVSNPSFELEEEEKGWEYYAWDTQSGVTDFYIDDSISHSGKYSALIINNEKNDARLIQKVSVKPNTYYKLSCWTKVKDIDGDKGANITIEGIMETSIDIKETFEEWKYIEAYILTSSNQTETALCVRLGGYNNICKGKAWFDDVEVVELQALPTGAQVIELSQNNKNNDNPADNIFKQKDSIQFIYVYFILFCFVGIIAYRLISNGFSFKLLDNKISIFIFLGAIILFKILFAPVIEGFPNDIGCFKSWAYHAADSLTNFYNGSFFCDYPPLYIYVLSIVGNIINIFNLSYDSNAALAIIKMPSIIAESVTAYLIFTEAKKHINKKTGFILATLYVLNPAIILNSTIWGQVDAFFALLILLMIIMVKKERLPDAAIMLALAILMKPHGLIFGPILLFEVIKRKNFKTFLNTCIHGVVTVILGILPFSFNQSPFWIVRLYMNTAGGYQHASLNAFNFFALIGANLKADSETWVIFSYGTWGYIFIILITLFIGWIYYKSKEVLIVPLTSAGIITGVFMLSTRMHERYLFTVLALLLISYIYFENKKILLLFFGFSATVFFNMQIVLSRMLTLGNPHIPPDNIVLIIISFVNFSLFIYLFKVIMDVLIKDKMETDQISS